MRLYIVDYYPIIHEIKIRSISAFFCGFDKIIIFPSKVAIWAKNEAVAGRCGDYLTSEEAARKFSAEKRFICHYD